MQLRALSAESNTAQEEGGATCFLREWELVNCDRSFHTDWCNWTIQQLNSKQNIVWP